ncbi:MAG: ABC transporter ATP-binding protein [Deltaproteobacteria bacterium]|nr:ABC transporter ATP-binding protein [Deltaproteobacteria bacterium]
MSDNRQVSAALEMQGIRKAFPGVVANDGVDLEVREGEIHALLGENGAGKTTLVNVLVGLLRPDAGWIRVHGRPVEIRSPRDALGLGIGMVHQDFLQSERHTALQNVVLGHPSVPFRPSYRSLRERVAALGERVGLRVNLDAPIHDLPVGERQKVEILRALFHEARFLVLDEPTAVLSPPEADTLFAFLGRFRSNGGAVVFITHKMTEVLALADRATILRRGRKVGTVDVAGCDARTLARLTIGRDPSGGAKGDGPPLGPEVAALEGVTVLDARGLPRLSEVTLSVRGGEILGVAGVAGSGQDALVEVLTGLARPARGTVRLHGRRVPRPSPAAFRAAQTACIPEDRMRSGVALELSVVANLVLGLHRTRFSRLGMIRWRAARAWAQERIATLGIACPDPEARVGTLSGGNVQKVILARELASVPHLLVAAHPCRGLDVGAAEDVRSQLVAVRDRGAAVVLVSEDLDEMLRLSTRMAVLFRGRLVGVLPAMESTREAVGCLMAGLQP